MCKCKKTRMREMSLFINVYSRARARAYDVMVRIAKMLPTYGTDGQMNARTDLHYATDQT